MDYVGIHHDDLPYPGKYDIAAIRYGYGENLLDNNGQVVKIQPDLSINQVMQAHSVKIPEHKYCHDYMRMNKLYAMCDWFGLWKPTLFKW